MRKPIYPVSTFTRQQTLLLSRVQTPKQNNDKSGTATVSCSSSLTAVATKNVTVQRGSVYVADNSAKIERYTDLPNPSSGGATIFGRTKKTATRTVYYNLVELQKNSVTSRSIYIQWTANDAEFRTGYYSTGGGSNTGSFSAMPSNDQWFDWAVTVEVGTGNIKAYWWPAASSTVYTATANLPDTGAWTPEYMQVMTNSLGGENVYVPGHVADVRVWNAVLTRAELERERWSTTPVRATSLNTAFDGTNPALPDISGNGRNWSTANLKSSATQPTATFLGATPSVTTVPRKNTARAVSVSGTTSVTTVGGLGAVSAISLSGATSLSTGVQKNAVVPVAVSAANAATATGRKEAQSSAAMSAATEISAAGDASTLELTGDATVGVSTSLTCVAQKGTAGAASVSVTSSPALEVQKGARGTAQASTATSITASGVHAGIGSATLSCASGVAVGGMRASFKLCYPNVILYSSHLSGAYTDIDEDPNNPDGSWLLFAA